MDTAGSTQKDYYPTTIWSEIGRAGKVDSPDALAALDGLLKKYYKPLQTHLQFKFYVTPEQAADLLQDFISRKMLQADLLMKASPHRGRFRTFLLNALDNFVVSQHRRDNTLRRKPEGGLESWEGCFRELTTGPASNRSDPYALEWARAVLAEAVSRMHAECEAHKCLGRWSIFKARLVDPILDGADRPSYEALTAQLGFQSPGEASNALTTAKRQFDRLLRQVVAEYAGEGSDVEEELRELKLAASGD